VIDLMIRKAWASVKTHIIAGIFVTVPLAVTFVVMRGFFDIIHNFFRPVLKLFVIIKISPFLEMFITFLLAASVVYLIGFLSKIIFVARLIRLGEGMLSRIPVVRYLYNTTKQIMDSIALMKLSNINKVVILEYPRKGILAMAFVTGVIRQPGKEDLISIFIPSTPNPTTGFYLMVPPEQIWDVNLTFEQGTKMIISGGIISLGEIEMKPFVYKPEEMKRPVADLLKGQSIL
jgi:uncharacterized membrane protein